MIFLATGFRTGWSGAEKLGEAFYGPAPRGSGDVGKIYGASTPGHNAANNMSLASLAAVVTPEPGGPRIVLADSTPSHSGWAYDGGGDRMGLKLRVLLSYHYYQNNEVGALVERFFRGHSPDIFLDSGAYSASTVGAVIPVADYIAYIQRNVQHLTAYANLDVIGDADATRENQLIMEDAGLKPLPVFHMGEPWSALEWYLERYQYIALGGMVGVPTQVLGKWLLRCFRIAGDSAVFHGFGITSWTLLKDFRWYSADSSSWGAGFRYGKIPLFDSRHGRIRRPELGDPVSCYKFAHLFREMGFEARDFAERERNDKTKICAVSALCYMLAEQWLLRRWGPVEIPGRSAAPARLPEEAVGV